MILLAAFIGKNNSYEIVAISEQRVDAEATISGLRSQVIKK